MITKQARPYFFCPWISCCPINHITSQHGSKMGREQTTRLNQWIFVLWSADKKLDSMKMWIIYKHTKPFYDSEAKQPSADTLIMSIFCYIKTVGWIYGSCDDFFFCAYKWESAFHTPRVCYTNQIWPTHTHTPPSQCQVFVLALISNARTREGRDCERGIRIGAINAVTLTGF